MTEAQRLSVHLHGRQVGLLEQSRGRVSFTYSENWLQEVGAGLEGQPLSLSLPLDRREHGPKAVEPFIAGLLPDLGVHRARIAQAFGLGPDQTGDVELLRMIGRDCAGAVTFEPLEGPADPEARPDCRFLSESELAQRLRALPQRPLLSDPRLGARSSLAGVNDKAAVVVMGERIGLPLNGLPSSHILKTDIPGLTDSIRTEHFCLRLAAACGLPTPESSIHQAEDIVYLRIARYDRALMQMGGWPTMTRLHQEDMCQALSIHPKAKYERQGGPGWKDLFRLMEIMSDPFQDRRRLLEYAIFQYLIGNPDAHGKNYAILHARDGATSLAPIYDLNNQAAFAAQFKRIKPLMSMSLGGEFLRPRVGRGHWIQFAEEIGLPAAQALGGLEEMAACIAPAAASLREELRGGPADTELLDMIVEDVRRRALAVGLGRAEAEMKGAE